MIQSQKRKRVSEAERIAVELFKVTFKQTRQSKLKFDQNMLVFQNSLLGDSIKGEECCWALNHGCHGRPRYCPQAEFHFETCLPDREYLTRYSVYCAKCQPLLRTPSFQLYCSYCDEVLTGSIAGPGGKIADHVVTIRHILSEAIVQYNYFQNKERISAEELHNANLYVSKLELWASAIRFKRNSIEKAEFDKVLRLLQLQLQVTNAEKVPCTPPLPPL
jgi:hypothetical protein